MHELELLAQPSDDRKVTPSTIHREAKLREELSLKLSDSKSWPGFIPQNPFSNLTGFKTLRDYIVSFTLHLPEIYEETFRVEACIERFLTGREKTALVDLWVGLQHLGRNHAGFVLQPLEWATDEYSWEE